VTQTPAGEALFDVIVGTTQTFFRLRAAGKQFGAVTPWGGGLWGMLHSLKMRGPQTVPQIARARPVARQRIQKIADELKAEGFIEYTDNPAHKRSKLLRLTQKGEALHAELTAEIEKRADQLAEGMDAEELRITADVLRRLRERLSDL